jgi:hypothetical protein
VNGSPPAGVLMWEQYDRTAPRGYLQTPHLLTSMPARDAPRSMTTGPFPVARRLLCWLQEMPEVEPVRMQGETTDRTSREQERRGRSAALNPSGRMC